MVGIGIMTLHPRLQYQTDSFSALQLFFFYLIGFQLLHDFGPLTTVGSEFGEFEPRLQCGVYKDRWLIFFQEHLKVSRPVLAVSSASGSDSGRI